MHYEVRHHDGQTYSYGDIDDAMSDVRARYGSQIVTTDMRDLHEFGRVLVWESDEDADNDDGRHTVCSIHAIKTDNEGSNV